MTDGEEGGNVVFEAEVEIRPEITVAEYDALEVTGPRPTVDEAEIDEQIEKFAYDPVDPLAPLQKELREAMIREKSAAAAMSSMRVGFNRVRVPRRASPPPAQSATAAP